MKLKLFHISFLLLLFCGVFLKAEAVSHNTEKPDLIISKAEQIENKIYVTIKVWPGNYWHETLYVEIKYPNSQFESINYDYQHNYELKETTSNSGEFIFEFQSNALTIAGSYTITTYCSVTANGSEFIPSVRRSQSINLTEILPRDIQLSPSSISVPINGEMTVNPVFTPNYTTAKSITWEPEDSSVAVVTNGIITGKGVGSTRISAKTKNGLMAYCNVTVYEDPDFRVKLSSSNFPDSYFLSYLKTYDKDNNGYLGESELKSITDLRLDKLYNGENIRSITGIDKLVYVERLNIGGTKIETLDLQGHPSLEHVEYNICWINNVKYDYLKKVNIKNLPSLNYLDISSDNISNFSISNCNKLESLYFESESYYGSLSLTDFPSLSRLWAIGSGIISIKLKNCPIIYDIYRNGTLTSYTNEKIYEKKDTGSLRFHPRTSINITVVSPTPTATMVPTNTPTITPTATMVPTNTPTFTPTATMVPTDIPTFTPTVAPDSYIPGDLNGDGKVGTADLVMMRRLIAGYDVQVFAPADVSGDGKVGTADLVLLRRAIAGYDVELK